METSCIKFTIYLSHNVYVFFVIWIISYEFQLNRYIDLPTIHVVHHLFCFVINAWATAFTFYWRVGCIFRRHFPDVCIMKNGRQKKTWCAMIAPTSTAAAVSSVNHHRRTTYQNDLSKFGRRNSRYLSIGWTFEQQEFENVFINSDGSSIAIIMDSRTPWQLGHSRTLKLRFWAPKALDLFLDYYFFVLLFIQVF